MKAFRITLFLLLIQHIPFAQITIQGLVSNANEHHPIESASIAILLCRDSSLVKSSISDSLGNFQLAVPASSSYLLSVSGLGFKPLLLKIQARRDTTLTLEPEMNSKTLEGITVSTDRLLVEKKIDRLVFNAGNSPFAVGSSAWDLLKKAPQVITDETGTIRIKALQGATVLINDRRIYLTGEELMNLLKNMPSDEVDKIEIITTPPARYDAEGSGGIINIVTKKNQKYGFNGSVTGGYEQTTYAKYNSGINLNYRSKKLNLFGNYSCRTGNYLKSEIISQDYQDALGNHTLYNETTSSKSLRTGNNYMLGADYFLNKNNTIGVLSEGSYTQRTATGVNTGIYSKPPGAKDSSMVSATDLKGNSSYMTVNLNYKGTLDSSGQTINADADYISYQVPLFSSLNSTRFYDAGDNLMNRTSLFSSNTIQDIHVYSLKLDYSRPLGAATKLELGGKASSTITNNEVDFQTLGDNNTLQPDTSKSNRFNYKENAEALYGNLSSSYHQFDFQLGLRAEKTNATGTDKSHAPIVEIDYLKLFPSVFVQFNQSNDLQLGLIYNRRITRPGFSDLNPFRNYITPYSYIQGNPFLQPFFTNAFDFSASVKNRYFFDVFCNLIDNQFTQVIAQNPLTNSYTYQTVNIDNSYNYGASVSSSLSVTKWWEINGSAWLMYNGAQSRFLGHTFDYQSTVFTITTGQSFTLSGKNKLSAEINGAYTTPGQIQGMFILGSMLDVSAAIKKQILKKKGTLAFTVNDIFRATYVTTQSNYLGQKNYITGSYDQQGIRIAFSYKFGSTTVEKNRKRETGNTEERSRVK